jgi:DNA-binding transcriptional regulator YiaG
MTCPLHPHDEPITPERLHAAYASMRRTFAANLRHIRRERGFKCYGAALGLGVSTSTWGRWEAAQRFPTPPLLAGIALLLRTPVADFFAPAPIIPVCEHSPAPGPVVATVATQMPCRNVRPQLEERHGEDSL